MSRFAPLCSAPFWRLANRFGVRLGLILTLALAPVGILALVQTAGRDDELQARTEAALAGETLRAAAPELVGLAGLQAVSRGLAASLGARPDADCPRRMAGLAGPGRPYAMAGVYRMDGSALCSAAPEFADVSAWSFLADFRAAPQTALRTVDVGPQAEGRLIIALTPIAGTNGQPMAFVAIGRWQIPMRDPASRATGGPLAVFLVDPDGRLLASTIDRGRLADFLPEGDVLAGRIWGEQGVFAGRAQDGEARLYSSNVLIPGEIHALGVWPEPLRPVGVLQAISPLTLPALTWAICLLAAWAVSELMVTRHMRRFRRAITAFAQGDRGIRPLAMASAPTEIRQAADAFEVMTDTIMKDEADLENSVREKEALLREVHHRVKNNLQLMASIINLQLRRTRSDEAKDIIRRLQDRMLSLATVHNGLFHTANLTEVRVDTLLSGIVAQVVVSGAGAGQKFDVQKEFDELSLSPEQVVPLALLLTEALGRAMKSAAAIGARRVPVIQVALRAEGEAVRLSVSHIDPDEEEAVGGDVDDDALGNQLIHAFALQLGGSYRRTAEGRHSLQRVDFRRQSPPGPASASATPQG